MATTLHTRRLAGIRFEHHVPEAPEQLPRMDIACFVGFASAGPLHTPVPLETAARFLDVFGPDLPLARDPATGRVRHAYLGPTVRAFFANGGRRCWVIRVGDETKAEASRVGLAGMLRIGASGLVQPAFAAARSAGAFFDGLDVRTSLAARGVALAGGTYLDSKQPKLRFTGSALRDLAPGDLIRLRTYRNPDEEWTGFIPLVGSSNDSAEVVEYIGGEPRWFLSVREPTPSASSELWATRFDTRGFDPSAPLEFTDPGLGVVKEWPFVDASGQRSRLAIEFSRVADAEALAGQWLYLTASDPTAGAPHPLSSNIWCYVRSATARADAGVGFAEVEGDAWWEGLSPPEALLGDPSTWIAEVVSLDMVVLHSTRDPAELLGLGFTPLHKRAWAALPNDETHFAPELRPLPSDVRAFRAEADSPRFSVAVGNPLHAADWFVPLGLDTLGGAGSVWHSARAPISRDGLETFGPEAFVDEALVSASVDALASEAEFIRFGLGAGHARSLRGVHAAWGIEEASIIAAPDCVHNSWERAPTAAIAAPEPPQAWPPTADIVFDDCLRRMPRTPVLSASEPDAQGSFTLTFSYAGEPGVCFVLQEAKSSDWSDAATIWTGGAESEGGLEVLRVIRGRSSGHYYYRVLAVACFAVPASASNAMLIDAARAWWERVGEAGSAAAAKSNTPCSFSGFERSRWSNGVAVSIAVASEWQEMEAHDYDAGTWLAVSRALVRLCAARGDAVALLAIPGHARSDQALALQAKLLAPGGLSLAVGATGLSLPLGARESAAWGYAALYHAWVTTSETDGSLLTAPPLGAIAGTYASRSLERGAWVAPANHPLTSVIGLAPPIPRNRQQDFLDRQLNLVRSEPPGFLVLSQDTLASDAEASDSPFRPMNVRRLMILLRRYVLRLGEPFVFEPNGENLRVRIRHAFESALARLQARGAFAGRTGAESYRVECGDDVNPPYGVEQGRLVVEIKIAPSRPLAFLTIRLVQIGDRNRIVEVT